MNRKFLQERSGMGNGASGDRSIARQRSRDDTSSTSSNPGTDRHGTSSQETKSDTEPVVPAPDTVADVWAEMTTRMQTASDEDYIKKRGAVEWHTVRIFVSSTFKDFHDEREVLIKQVFQDLRIWCEQQRLRLMDIDLRWGVPKETNTEGTLGLCLEEIERCKKENTMPYFISLLSARAGWVPEKKHVSPQLMDKYKMVYGLSITEMEIVQGAFKFKNNPNAIFLLRDDSFLNELPEEVKFSGFQQKDKKQQEQEAIKLTELKKQIMKQYQTDQVFTYKCSHFDKDRAIRFDFEPEDIFKKNVLEFFKKRISVQYPEDKYTENDLFHKDRLAHESFMKLRSLNVLGRNDIIEEIMSYVTTDHSLSPLLVVGGPGIGKSALMALAVNKVLDKIKRQGFFYHFVGAVPRSTELKEMLIRLLLDLGRVTETTLPPDLNSAAQMVSSILRSPSTPHIVIMVDAVNQFDECTEAQLVSWIPHKLAPKVRCILSMIPGTPQHKNLSNRRPKPREIIVQPLTRVVCKKIVTDTLKEYNKDLEPKEMKMLLDKTSSTNPLWLSIACEELHVFGKFRRLVTEKERETIKDDHVYLVPEKINNFSDSLEGLLCQVFDRFHEECGEEEGRLLEATLCLLEVSKTGLVEEELLCLLSDVDHLLPDDDKPEEQKREKEKTDREKPKLDYHLPAIKWATVMRALSKFLRPFGSLGEGRLDFYHRSMSKVVRERYLHQEKHATSGKLNRDYKWWHEKLADFFYTSTIYYRKAEELPYHLIRLKDTRRLEAFLSEWKAFDELFNVDLSTTLFSYWRECDDPNLTKMKQRYCENLQKIVKKADLADKQAQIGRLLVQASDLPESLSLAEKALELEKSELQNHNQHTDRLINVYSLLAQIYSQRSKRFQSTCHAQLEDVKPCVEYNRQAIDLLQKQTKKSKLRHTKLSLGKQKMQLAFALSQMDQIQGHLATTVKKITADAECKKVIKETKQLFETLGDLGSKAEIIMIDAMSHWRPPDREQQRKLYEDAWKYCQQNYGRHHILASRIQHNWAVAYESIDDHPNTYEHFKQAFLIKYAIYGATHEATERALAILRKDLYKPFHKENKVMTEAKNQ